MSYAQMSLSDRVAVHVDADMGFSPAIIEAMRLADMFGDLKAEEFSIPTSDTFDAYRPLKLDRMLVICDGG